MPHTPPARLTRALVGLVVLALLPCLVLLVLPQTPLAHALASPLLSSSSPEQLKRITHRAAMPADSVAATLPGGLYTAPGEPEPAATSLTIASFNIRYSKDANYDSARAPLARLKRFVTRGKQTQFGIDDAPLPLRGKHRDDAATTANPSLRQKYWGERSWFLRGPRIADTVLFNHWDIFAMQEVLDAPYSNLRQWLSGDYDTVGVGRNDGMRAGEAVPVWWKRDRFDLVPASQGGVGEQGFEHFWLSPTPEKVGSVGWDADLTRMCTHVALRLRTTGEMVHVFSTHYDHKGVVARRESSKLILARAQRAAEETKRWQRIHGAAAAAVAGEKGDGEPLVVLIGDLNSPRDEGSWTSLVGGHYGVPLSETGSDGPSFLDTALSVPTLHTSPYLSRNEDETEAQLASGAVAPHPFSRNLTSNELGYMSLPYGPLRTFTDFEPSDRDAVEDRIDFVMLLDNGAVKDETRRDAVLSPAESLGRLGGTEGGGEERKVGEGRWRIRSYGVLSSWSEGDAGFLVSDHRPVVARIERR